jgi:hypothetical protein
VSVCASFDVVLGRLKCDEVLANSGIVPPHITYREFQSRVTELHERKRSGLLSPDDIVTLCRDISGLGTLGDQKDEEPTVPDFKTLGTAINNYYEYACIDDEPRGKLPHKIQREFYTIMSEGWVTAWYTEYEDRALNNFMDYLDSLWVQRMEGWTPGLTSHSICATIVQSSCAGKSRLVYSYVS